MKKLVFLSLLAFTLNACFGTEESSSDELSSEEIRDSLLVVLDSIGVNTSDIDEDLLDSLVSEYDSYDFDEDELEELFKESLNENPNQPNQTDSIPEDTNKVDTNQVDSSLVDPMDEIPDHSMDSTEIAEMKASLVGSWIYSQEVLLPITESSYQQDPVLGFIEIKDTVGYDTLYNTKEFQFAEDNGIREITTTANPYYSEVETLEGEYEIVDGVILYTVQTNTWAPEHLYAIKVGDLMDNTLKLSPTLVGIVEIEEPIIDSVETVDSTETQDTTETTKRMSKQIAETAQVDFVNEWFSSRVVFANRVGADEDGMISITDSEINAYYTSATDTSWVIQSSYSQVSPGEISLANHNDLVDVSYQYQIISNKLILYNPSEEETFEKQ